MAGSILKLNDAQLQQIEQQGDTLILHFNPITRIKSEGMPDVDPSTLWDQQARIHLLQIQIADELPAQPLRILGGDISINGTTYRDIIPLPLDTPGYCELELNSNEHDPLILRAERIRVELFGIEKYRRHIHIV